MSLLGGLGKWLRDEFDNVGSVVTGQPAHSTAPVNPAPQPVVNAVQNAKYGVLANNPQAQGQFIHSLQPQAPQPPQAMSTPGASSTPQPPHFSLTNNSFTRGLSRSYDQLNPFDNGRTWQNPNGNGQQSSVFQQATHNGLTNLAGDIAKPIIRTGMAVNQGIGNAELKIAGRPTLNAQQFTQSSYPSGLNKAVGYTGTKRQIAGDVANTALTAITPGVGNAVEKSFTSVLPKVVPKVVSRVVANAGTGAVVGAPMNVANLVSSDQKITPKAVKESAVQGAKMGAVLGGAGTAGAEVASKVAPVAARALSDQLHKLPDAVRANNLRIAAKNSPVQNIGIGKLTSYEGAPDTARVNFYKQQILAGKPTEPLIAMKDSSGKLGIEDGKHRFEAYRQLGYKQVPVRVTTPEQIHSISQGGYIRLPGADDDMTAPPQKNETPNKATSSLNDGVGSLPNDQSGQVVASPSKVTQLRPDAEQRVFEENPLKPTESVTTPLERDVKLTSRPDKNIHINGTAMTEMHDILNSGGTVDEAMNAYMHRTGGTFGQAQLALQRVFDTKSIDKKSVNAKLNPQYGGVKIGAVKQGDVHQPVLNARAIRQQVIEHGNNAVQKVRALDDHDLQLMDNIRSTAPEELATQAHNPQAFIEAAEAVKQYNDFTHAAGSGLLEQDVPYRQNYGAPLLFDTSTPEAQTALEAAKAKLKSQPGYGQHRFFKDYDEAVSYGAKRLHNNFAEDLAYDINRRSNDLPQLTLAKSLEEAFPGQVKVGEIGSTPDGTFKQLQIPGGQKISMPAEIADKINARATPEASKGALRLYDKANANIKYLKLGGGMFHALTEGMNFLGQQIASGKIFTPEGLKAQVRVIGSTFSKAMHEDSLNYFEKNGTLQKAQLAGVTISPQEILGDANPGVLEKLKGTVLKPINDIHDMVFQREIPIQKLSIFEQATKNLDVNNPADVAKMRQAATAVNHLFGGLNRSVDGALTPKTAKMLSRAVLATDFTEAKIRTVGDALTKKGVQGNIARQAVIGKTLVAAAPGLIALTMAHKINWNDPKDVAKNVIDQVLDPHFPTPFKTKSGIMKITKTPETFVSEFGRLITPMFADGPDKKSAELNALQHYGAARLAALPSVAEQALTNKDYNGNPVIERDTNGKIKLAQTAGNAALQVAPIPVVQAVKVAQGKETGAEAALNTAGFRTVADPNDPKMKSLNFQNQVVSGLSQQDKAAWNVVHGKMTDQNGNPRPNTSPADIVARYTTQLDNPAVIEADKQIDAYKQSIGQPGDPFYKLSPDQQKTYLALEALKTLDPGDNSGTATQMEAENKGWIDKFNNDRQSYFQQLNLPPSNKTYLIPKPTVTPQVAAAMQGAQGLTGAEYSAYTQAHPELNQYYAALDKSIRAQRNFFNEPQFKAYPTPSDRVNSLLNQASSLTGKAHSAIFKDPEVSNYLADIAMWQLNQGAAKARFEGNDYTQKDLKNLYSIGNYDVVKLQNGQYAQVAGTLSNGQGLAGSGYTTGGTAGFTPGQAPAVNGYGKYGSKSKPKYFKVHPRRVKVRHVKKPKVFLKKPPSPIKIKNKTNQHPGIHRTTYL